MEWGTGMEPARSCTELNGAVRHGAAAVSRIAFAISAFVALSACEQNSFVPPPPPKVDVGVPVQRNVTRYLEATGNTAPIKTVDLVARVQGFLQSINYQDGTSSTSASPMIKIRLSGCRSYAFLIGSIAACGLPFFPKSSA
jgi:hypothetical protein